MSKRLAFLCIKREAIQIITPLNFRSRSHPRQRRSGMTYSNNSHRLDRLWRVFGGRYDPGFSVVISFDFYDGPESGLAIYASGKGVRFSSLGDSPLRFFRAFELTSITGEWWQPVQSLPEISASREISVSTVIAPISRVVLPSASDALTALESNVSDATATEYSVGVGAPYLEWLLTCSVTAAELGALRQLDNSSEAFRLAHDLVKRHIGECPA